ncbi:hypothetical protein H6G81_16875 [Scytonema hofmannii FACHB-248]|uniref:Uncharacterized protein n=1 Tax=Scytonema hofmannii FACHB-248 TaxID=1842502 RepID=A0ABR8GRR9_9CYAN|nr:MULTISPECIES: hypothetical protein [Nostocales]MBD2606154.1 hypothetical protein [Scytonema hofmannii FACHB-248]
MKLVKEPVGLFALGLSLALSIGIYVPVIMAQTSTNSKTVQVGIGLETRNATKEQIAREIKRHLNSRKILVTDQEVETAASNAVNKLGTAKDPQKGVIYIHTKKFTICLSWGRDKDFCKSH